MTNSQLYGLSEDHLIAIDSVHKLQPEAAAAFSCMQQAAKEDGVQIEIASSFRGFDRQLAIWNRKFNSETLSCLEPQARIESIMRWSALPGTSRHHWGTDCDLYDPTQLQGATLQLEPWEYEVGGPCAEVFDWLQNTCTSVWLLSPVCNRFRRRCSRAVALELCAPLRDLPTSV